jgi:hypothetical protein
MLERRRKRSGKCMVIDIVGSCSRLEKGMFTAGCMS